MTQKKPYNIRAQALCVIEVTAKLGRMDIAIDRILKKYSNKNVVIFTHKRAIMGYLLKYLDKGYNLDDRLILTFNDKVIVDDIEKDVDIIKMEWQKGKIINVDIIL